MHISEINIYPIKSLKGIRNESVKVEERGLRYDRRWMLTSPDGVFMTQRGFPRMATIGVEVTGDGLQVTSEDAGEMVIPFEADRGERAEVVIWQSVCGGEVYRGAVSEWFSDVLGTNCQLVYMPDTTRRQVSEVFNEGDEIVSFADGYPVLVIGEASLDDLNLRLETTHADEPSAIRLPMNRFRPNIVVAGSAVYAEDDWREIRIGEAIFHGTKPCARCVITTVDQSKGEFDGKEPLKTLASYRMAKDVIPDRYEAFGMNETAVLFGLNLIAESAGATIRVGDEVRVIEKY